MKSNKTVKFALKKVNIAALPTDAAKYIVLLVFVILSIGPILWVFMSSFKSHQELFSGSAFSLPSKFSLDNYIRAVQLAPIGRFFINSVIIGALNTVFCIFIVACCAYVVARFNFKMKGIIVALISAALLLPTQSISQPLFALFKTLNLFDTKTGLIFVYMAFGVPVTFFILRSFFLSIPRSLEESAYIDGAGFFRTFVTIILPLARPGLATAAILQFISSWNEFYFALMLTSGNNARTVPIALNYYTSTFNSEYGPMFAAVILTILPTIIIFIIAQEQVVESLTAGAIKG